MVLDALFHLDIHENYVIVKPEVHYLIPFSALKTLCCQFSELK